MFDKSISHFTPVLSFFHIESVRSRVKTPPCGRFVNNGGVPDKFQIYLVTRGLWQTTEMQQIFQKSLAVVPDKTSLNLKWQADCEHWFMKCTEQNSLEQKASDATYPIYNFLSILYNNNLYFNCSKLVNLCALQHMSNSHLLGLSAKSFVTGTPVLQYWKAATVVLDSAPRGNLVWIPLLSDRPNTDQMIRF